MNIVEVVIVNYDAPENIARIVKAIKKQTVDCTITICDLHKDGKNALDYETVTLADRVLRWEHEKILDSYIKFPMLYEHAYTFFLNDKILPSEKCIGVLLNIALENPSFGVLGLRGYCYDESIKNLIRPLVCIDGNFRAVDFLLNACFIKTENLRYVFQLLKYVKCKDHHLTDIYLCAALNMFGNLPCFVVSEYLQDINEKLFFSQDKQIINQNIDPLLRQTNLTEFIRKLMFYGWSTSVYSDRKMPKIIVGPSCPRFSICLIVLNEAEYITFALDQVYNWDCCHQIIIVEGSVEHYPKENLSASGLSGDGTTELILSYPDPQKKIQYISGTFKDKVEQRNEYAKRVTGTHVLVMDADELYSFESLSKLKTDVINNPDADIFTFNFSQNNSERTYFHLWHGLDTHVTGGYWDISHNRIYKWTPGTLYKGKDHNEPVRPDNIIINSNSHYNKCVATRAICVHMGFAKISENQTDKNLYYRARGEGKEDDKTSKASTHMAINCRDACENWQKEMPLPYGARLFRFDGNLPESLTKHPLFQLKL